MFLSSISNIEAIASTLVAAGGIYSGVRSLLSAYRRKKSVYRQAILDEAQQHAELMKIELEAKIKSALDEIQNIKNSVEGDLSNLKNNHSIELKNLGEKVQLLREELQDQSRGILALLTKLVDK
jgi:hypothetical protein